jgi:hypothetical protein
VSWRRSLNVVATRSEGKRARHVPSALLAAVVISSQAVAVRQAQPPFPSSSAAQVHDAATGIRGSPAQQRPASGADFRGETASGDVRRVANWIMASRDNRGLPFVLIDKVDAKVFVFNRGGALRGAAAALLGLGRGDDGAADIGERKLAMIPPSERTTPAGRYQAALGHDLHQDILWIDYDAALSLHRVIVGSRKDHRAERLASASPLDNRISFGCINVTAEFYDDVVIPAFTGTVGIVYILPDTRPLRDFFPVAQQSALAGDDRSVEGP